MSKGYSVAATRQADYAAPFKHEVVDAAYHACLEPRDGCWMTEVSFHEAVHGGCVRVSSSEHIQASFLQVVDDEITVRQCLAYDPHRAKTIGAFKQITLLDVA